MKVDEICWTKQEFPAGLRTHHQNLLTYFQHHRSKYPNAPCFVPKAPNNHLHTYLRALEKLEELNLLRVIRDGESYLNWIMAPAKPK